MNKIFAEDDKFQNTILLISGVFLGLSQIDLLPYANNLFLEYYENLTKQNCLYDKNCISNQKQSIFQLIFLFPCMSFGLAMFIERVIGYDYEEQTDETIEDLFQKQLNDNELTRTKNDIENAVELVELKDWFAQNQSQQQYKALVDDDKSKQQFQQKSQQPTLETINQQFQQNNTQERVDKQILVEQVYQGYDDVEEEDRDNFKGLNMVYINISLLMLGIALGQTRELHEYLYMKIPCFIYVFLIGLQYQKNLEKTEYKRREQRKIMSVFGMLFISGMIIGIALSYFTHPLFLSYSIAFHSGTLLYISTFKLIQKYYDSLGNRFVYFFSFFIGFLMISYLIK